MSTASKIWVSLLLIAINMFGAQLVNAIATTIQPDVDTVAACGYGIGYVTGALVVYIVMSFRSKS
jgi:hypothetical protein